MIQTLNFPGSDLKVEGLIDTSKFGSELTVASIISRLLLYIFPIAGLILFFMLIAGGFGLLTSAGNPEKTKVAQGKIVSAIVGFIIIFAAYWLVQILQTILGFKILG